MGVWERSGSTSGPAFLKGVLLRAEASRTMKLKPECRGPNNYLYYFGALLLIIIV